MGLEVCKWCGAIGRIRGGLKLVLNGCEHDPEQVPYVPAARLSELETEVKRKDEALGGCRNLGRQFFEGGDPPALARAAIDIVDAALSTAKQEGEDG